MANSIVRSPFILDTPGAPVIWSGNINIENIEFVGYPLASDTCIIQDQNGRLVWQGHAAADLSTQRSGKIGWTNGLVLATLTGGKILVFVK